MKSIKLTTWIMVGMVLGIGVGAACHGQAASPDAAKEIAGYFNLVADIFLRLIKMITAPLVVATLVSGIASMSDGKALGWVGLSRAWQGMGSVPTTGHDLICDVAEAQCINLYC